MNAIYAFHTSAFNNFATLRPENLRFDILRYEMSPRRRQQHAHLKYRCAIDETINSFSATQLSRPAASHKILNTQTPIIFTAI